MMRGSGRVAGRSIEAVLSVHGSRLPAPLIVPGAVVEVQERVDASGTVVVELDADAAVEQITRMIAEYELDSVAIALLWSFANPTHEQALARTIPGVFVSRSSEVSPRLGEYERTVATVLNGYVGPASSRYLPPPGREPRTCYAPTSRSRCSPGWPPTRCWAPGGSTAWSRSGSLAATSQARRSAPGPPAPRRRESRRSSSPCPRISARGCPGPGRSMLANLDTGEQDQMRRLLTACIAALTEPPASAT
jgi:hypothetical protein